MKNTLRHIIVFSFLLVIIFNLSCKKATKGTSITIEGLLYTDYLGNPISSYGNTSDDWGFSTSLSQAEINLFNFSDAVNMTGTVQLSNPKILPAYPNPAKTYIGFVGQFGSSSQLTKLKVVIVDPYLNVSLRDALLVSGTGQYFFSLANYAYQKHGVYRIYYSLSAEGKPNYKMGYGDFQICPGYITLPNCP